MNAEPERVSKAEYARMRGISSAYVSKLHRKNRLVLDARGLVIVKSTDVLVAASRDPTRGGDRTGKHAARREQLEPESMAPVPAGAPPEPAAKPEALSLADAARVEKVMRGRLLQMEIAERAGELVRRDVVEREAFQRARQAQESLMGLKDRLVPLLEAAADASEVERILDSEFRHLAASIASARPIDAERAA